MSHPLLPIAALATYICPVCREELEVVGTVIDGCFEPDDATETLCCHTTAELAGWCELTREDCEADTADRMADIEACERGEGDA